MSLDIGNVCLELTVSTIWHLSSLSAIYPHFACVLRAKKNPAQTLGLRGTSNQYPRLRAWMPVHVASFDDPMNCPTLPCPLYMIPLDT